VLAVDAGRLWQKLLVFAFCLIGEWKPSRSRGETHAGVAAGAEPERGHVETIDEQRRAAASIGTHVSRMSRGPLHGGRDLAAVTRNR
jgi:hypothetical protein